MDSTTPSADMASFVTILGPSIAVLLIVVIIVVIVSVLYHKRDTTKDQSPTKRKEGKEGIIYFYTLVH